MKRIVKFMYSNVYACVCKFVCACFMASYSVLLRFKKSIKNRDNRNILLYQYISFVNKNYMYLRFTIWCDIHIVNDYYNQANQYISQSCYFLWEHLKSTLLANFQYSTILLIVSLTIDTMLYIRSLDLLILYNCYFVPFDQHRTASLMP